MPEEWRPVIGYEGSYEVSNLGSVKSLPRLRVKGGMKSQFLDSNGYPSVNLSRNGKVTGLRVHRLVAEAFLGPRPQKHDIRHLDGNRQNNRVENLAYSTHAENMHDVVRHGTSHQAAKTHCPQGHPYAADNTVRTGRRQARRCAICRRQQSLDFAERSKAKKAAAIATEDAELRAAGLVPTPEAAQVIGVAATTIGVLTYQFADFPPAVKAKLGARRAYFNRDALMAWRARHPGNASRREPAS